MRFALLLPLLLVACAQDPYDRPGTWSVPQGSVGSNDANLRTMVTDPRDLVSGVNEPNTTAVQAAPPVKRLLTGKRPPLPQSAISTLRTGGDSAQPVPQNGATTPSQ